MLKLLRCAENGLEAVLDSTSQTLLECERAHILQLHQVWRLHSADDSIMEC